MGQITNFPNTVNVGILSIADVEVTATAAQINAIAGGGISNATTANKTVGAGDVGKLITLNRAAGIAVTLPAATGSGTRYEFFIGTTASGGTGYTITAAGNDLIFGTAYVAQDGGNTILAFETGVGDNSIALNGTTSGGIKGDRVTLIDAALDTWSVTVLSSATGTEVTPFEPV
jgi:hypothetical protein